MVAQRAAGRRTESAAPQEPLPDDDWDLDEQQADGDQIWDPLDPDDEEPEPEYGDFWFEQDRDFDE